MVAEVEVHRDTGRVRVTRAVVASDCGLIINPNGLQQQVALGLFSQWISRVLMEEVKFDRSKVTSLNWSSYPILTFPETPEVEVVLINRPDIPSSGIGELATIPTGGAVANAIFDAIGLRLRQVPLHPTGSSPLWVKKEGGKGMMEGKRKGLKDRRAFCERLIGAAVLVQLFSACTGNVLYAGGGILPPKILRFKLDATVEDLLPIARMVVRKPAMRYRSRHC